MSNDDSIVLNPVGTIVAYGGKDAPTGWIICDGSAISREKYYELYEAIGEVFGNGDKTTTFNVPDLRGRFLRGVDNMGRGDAARDPDSATRTAMNDGGNTGDAVGSVQTDEVGPHTHKYSEMHDERRLTYSGSKHFSVFEELKSGDTDKNTGSETRPINAYVTYIIFANNIA